MSKAIISKCIAPLYNFRYQVKNSTRTLTLKSCRPRSKPVGQVQDIQVRPRHVFRSQYIGLCQGLRLYSSLQSPVPTDASLNEDVVTLREELKMGDPKNLDMSAPDDDSIDSSDTLDVQYITNGDPVLERKLQVLILEVEVLRQEGRKVPSAIKNSQWKELVNTTSRSARRKYLTFLCGIEYKKESKKRKKEDVKAASEDSVTSFVDDGHIAYGLNRNTIIMRVYDTTINQLSNNKLIQAMQFGQNIVVDCGYDRHMTNREASNAAKQITFLFSENRTHDDPFNVTLCNANRHGHTIEHLMSFIPTLYDDHFPLNVTEKSYLDLFPKESIVYLTPHCREELTEFDHDSIYVIGAMVDKVNTEPLSLAKAKKEGLRMAKLPLERYLNWGSGSGKSLTLNQMMLIMLEMKTSGNWQEALKHVPRRKLNYDDPPGSQYQARYRKHNQATKYRY